MKSYDIANLLRPKLEDKLNTLDAQWRKACTGTTLEQQFGWLSQLPEDPSKGHPPAGPGALREFVVGGAFKGTRCMLPYRHSVEACSCYHVIRVGVGRRGLLRCCCPLCCDFMVVGCVRCFKG